MPIGTWNNCKMLGGFFGVLRDVWSSLDVFTCLGILMNLMCVFEMTLNMHEERTLCSTCD